MDDRRALVLSLLLAPFIFHVPHSHATGIPITVQDAIGARTDQNHKLQPPVVDAGPAMQGVYIYFLMNVSNVQGALKIIPLTCLMRICYFLTKIKFGMTLYLIVI